MHDNFTLLNMFNHQLIQKDYDYDLRKLYVSINGSFLKHVCKNAYEINVNDIQKYLSEYVLKYDNVSISHVVVQVSAFQKFYSEFLKRDFFISESLLQEEFATTVR